MYAKVLWMGIFPFQTLFCKSEKYNLCKPVGLVQTGSSQEMKNDLR